MFRKVAINTGLLILAIFLFGACSGYEKLLKNGSIEAKYEGGMQYYEEGNYLRAATLFGQIIPRLKGTTRAEELDYLNAKCHYEMGDYVMAGHYFREFVRTYFTSPRAEEADFMGAYCYYKLNSRVELDQTNTYNAINAFSLFKTKFPNSERIPEADTYIKEMQEKLVEKSYINAKLYYDLEKYKASIVAISNSLMDYPDTKYREELLYLKLRSVYLMATQSVSLKQLERFQDTVDEYYSFIDEFPESNYAREAERIYNESSSFLAKNN
ncbi:MAG: outer membrane protein assembly factor BamD [Bacteroidota bacterium]|nr:outer membrane protein assembly factor BamD [Bacteroidota bacterium]